MTRYVIVVVSLLWTAAACDESADSATPTAGTNAPNVPAPAANPVAPAAPGPVTPDPGPAPVPPDPMPAPVTPDPQPAATPGPAPTPDPTPTPATADASVPDEIPGPLAFTDSLTTGATIPARHKCPSSIIGSGTGDNLSPPLAWTGGPADTQSFAIVLFDTRYNLFHWALWDIPAASTMLPEGIPSGFEVADPAGARQGGTASAAGTPNAYFGPCSDAGPAAGTYEFRLYALSAASLGLSAGATSTEIQAAIDAATLEMTEWEGTPE